MEQMEKRYEILQEFTERLREKYETLIFGDTECFSANGSFFILSHFPGENALVVEYTYEKRLAEKGLFGEDGDRYYIDEMNKEELWKSIIEEIEGQGEEYGER